MQWSKDDFKDARDYCISFYEAGKDYTQPYFDNFLLDYQDYKCYMDTQKDDYKYLINKMFMPMTFLKREYQRTRLVLGIK